MGADSLSAALWRQRNMLELLLYKLETEKLLVSSGQVRWLGHCTREIDTVRGHLGTAMLQCDVESTALAEAWNIPGDPTLRKLAENAPEGPWKEILAAHLDAISQLVADVEDLKASNTRYLAAAQMSLQESAAADPTNSLGYTARGKATAAPTARLVDRSF